MSIRAAVMATVTLLGLLVIIPMLGMVLNYSPLAPVVFFGGVLVSAVWYALYLTFKDYE